MIKFVFLLGLLSLTITVKDDLIPATQFVAPQAVQDLKTKVIYYLESDHRHVAAIDPEGKILWCCEVLSEKESKEYHHYVANILLNADKDFISVGIWVGGFTAAYINKKTGAIRFGREVS
jgi:hypothetical protein